MAQCGKYIISVRNTSYIRYVNHPNQNRKWYGPAKYHLITIFSISIFLLADILLPLILKLPRGKLSDLNARKNNWFPQTIAYKLLKETLKTANFNGMCTLCSTRSSTMAWKLPKGKEQKIIGECRIDERWMRRCCRWKSRLCCSNHELIWP